MRALRFFLTIAILTLLAGCGGCGQSMPAPGDTLAALEQAWQAHPNDDIIAGQLATAYRDANRPDDARRLYAAALTLNPADAEWLMQLKALNGDFAPVIAQLQKDIASDSRNDEAHGNLGRILIAFGQPQEAQPHLLQALAINPGSASWSDLLSETGYDTRLLAAAIAAHGSDSRAAISVTGAADDDEYWGNLAKARWAAGDRDGARQALAKAAALDSEDGEWYELQQAWRAAPPR
ncbi:MAG TPA: tetratricopeptide repeat protein [bacterium]|nr:tetratricopeptide repeat protein [bacterium]